MLRTSPVSAETLLDHVKPGADLIIPIACGEPTTLVDALEANNEQLAGVRIHQMHVLHERPYLAGDYYDRLRHVSYFLSPITRKHFWAGTIDLIPANFSELPETLHRTATHPVVVAATSLPDDRGYFSLGTNADYVAPLIGKVPFFLEATPHMPRTIGVNEIHESQVAGWIESDRTLPLVPPIPRSELDEKIASFIAPEIANGSTLQVGIGGVPNAVMALLKDHKELGVHTELLSDGLVELVECGAITGSQKKFQPHKLVSTFCMGSQHLYDWLDGNELVEMLPVDHVNDPRIIGREPDFVAINATAEVDLFGQCASETIAGQYWSSSGGQADFSRGAMFAERGKAFMVLHSTTADGTSKIRAQLTPGAVVTTNKNTIDHIVTEYGIARMRGRTITERAFALIEIAHPDHREQLERDAHACGILRR
jgi:acyl-CoA hydrolase